jgi:hypothetical protein
MNVLFLSCLILEGMLLTGVVVCFGRAGLIMRKQYKKFEPFIFDSSKSWAERIRILNGRPLELTKKCPDAVALHVKGVILFYLAFIGLYLILFFVYPHTGQPPTPSDASNARTEK